MISYYLKQTIKTNKETIKKLSSLDKVLEKVTSSNISKSEDFRKLECETRESINCLI